MKKYILLYLSCLSLLLACGSKRSPKTETYRFPDKTIIHDIEKDNCLEGGDWVVKGKNIEDGLLKMLGKEVTTEQQIEAGEEFHKEILKEFRLADESHPQWKKLRKLVEKMKPFVARQDIEYTPYLLDDTLLNAFTIPGGNIYVTTRLMQTVASDDELAVIVGHEMGHNENKHTEKHLQRMNLAEAWLGKEAGQIAAALTQFLTLPYGQPQELEADRAGVYLAYKAGYEPAHGLDFFARFDDPGNHGTVERFLATHPFPKERNLCLQKYLDRSRVAAYGGKKAKSKGSH